MINGNNTPATANENPTTAGAKADVACSGTNGIPSSSPLLKKAFITDGRLESIKDTLELLPQSVQDALASIIIGMMELSAGVRDKNKGIYKLQQNESLMPKPCNVNCKLPMPDHLKKLEKMKDIESVWFRLQERFKSLSKDVYINMLMIESEQLILDRWQHFIAALQIVASQFVSVKDKIETEQTNLDVGLLGNVAVYCVINVITHDHQFYKFMNVDKETVLQRVKAGIRLSSTEHPIKDDDLEKLSVRVNLMTERPDLINKQEITSLSAPRERLTSAALGNITDNNNNNNNNNNNHHHP